MDGKKLKKLLLKYWFLLLLVTVFFLRLPSLFEPFTYGDEGVYLTLGMAIRKGLTIYKDIYDNKPPLIYLLGALAGGFWQFRMILFFWSFAAIFFFRQLATTIFKGNNRSVAISTVAFAIFSTIHSFEGNVANAENFMILPIILGFYLLVRKGDEKKVLFRAGILFSLATLLKVPAIFDFATGMILLLIVFLDKKQKNYLLLLKQYIWILLGFLAPIFITFWWFFLKGALGEYINAAFLVNIPYLSSWIPNKPKVGLLPIPLFGRGLMVMLIALFFLFNKKFSKVSRFLVIWFSLSAFAALLSSRPYPHYLIQVLPSLGLSLGLLFSKEGEVPWLKEKIIPLVLITALVVSLVVFKFWHYANLPYYLNFYQFITGQKNKNQYFSFFGENTIALYKMASYIQSHSSAEEKIFVWGNQPSIYVLSKRLPIGKYTTAYHIVDFDGYKDTIYKLVRNPPRLIVFTGDESRSFSALEGFIQRNYSLAFQDDKAKIFHRNFNFNDMETKP